MNISDAIKLMIKTSGNTAAGVSASLGKSQNLIAQALKQAREKNAGMSSKTIAAIARECGYVLALIPKDSAEGQITIDE